MSLSPEESNPLTFLTLGDGDFSFSLDLATYLADEKVRSQQQHETWYGKGRKIHLVATGIDSIDELTEKYKDSHFLLKRLISLNGNNLSVKIQHDVNAVMVADVDSSNAVTNDDDASKAHHVIFNHPHLGTEDAVLHSRFLCHLFHAVTKSWLQNGGLFHLTLVKGQAARWECSRAADRAGMVLVDECPFRPIPITDAYYQHRRHQTGKSFVQRARGGSETLTFARKQDEALWKGDGNGSARLLWYRTVETNEKVFECPHCERTFKEERSVKNHVKSKHATEKKRKRDTDEDTFVCSQCQPEPRTFESSQALEDHIQAKHSALHTDITPDWYRASETEMTSSIIDNVDFGECDICGLKYCNQAEEAVHSNEFLPVATPMPEDECNVAFNCSYCSKSFRENRAKLQHENICSARSV
jgi:uncharacterized C2H2 Zn-finger protein